MELGDIPTGDALTEPRPWYRYIEVFDRFVPGPTLLRCRDDARGKAERLFNKPGSNGREERRIVTTYHPEGESIIRYHGQAKEPSFVVTKSHSSQTFHLELFSPSLHHQLLPVCLDSRGTNLSFKHVVQAYLMLKERASGPMANAEIHLLVHDFLSCPKLYDGINPDWVFRQSGPGGVELEKDIHAKRVDMGLDNLDFLFVLGQAREPPNPQYFKTFRRVFDRLVESGDVDGLGRVCEPLVATGKIEWRHSDELLTTVLRTGNLAVFRYILDLATRTQPPNHVTVGYPDCTFHPLYMATRLGHLETVEALVSLGETFDGFCKVESNGSQTSSVPLDPITAAAYWGQAPALRLLLKHGLATEFSAEAALNLARSRGHHAVVQELQHSRSLLRVLPGLHGQSDFSLSLGLVASQPTVETPMSTDMPARFLDTGQFQWDDSSALRSSFDTISGSDPCLFETSTLQALQGNRSTCHHEKTTPNIPDVKSQEFGSRLSSALQTMCFEVQSHAFKLSRPDLADKFRGFGRVWERGMATIRLITRNKPPSCLRGVLDCLLVAAAITKAKDGRKTRAVHNFIADFECWRCAVPEKDQATFDFVTQSVWGPPADVVGNWDQEGQLTAQRFHGVVDKLVLGQGPNLELPVSLSDAALPDAVFDHAHQFPPSSVPQEYLNSDWEQLQTHSLRRSLSQLSGGAGWPEYSTSLPSLAVDCLNCNGIFPHSPNVGSTDGPPTTTTPPPGVLPLVKRLLGSVALGVVFSMLIIVQIGSETPETQLIAQQRYSLSSACAILGKFIDMLSGSAALSQPQLPTIVTPPTDYLSIPELGGPTPSTGVSSEGPAPSTVTTVFDAAILQNYPSPQAGTLSPLIPPLSPGYALSETGCSPRGRSPSQSSFLSDQSGNISPPDEEQAGGASPRRRSDPCGSCGRTFSSVTNLRKHLRDKVCLPGSKMRFPCRNGGCDRLLSTRWYRQQHEEQYCQSRRSPQGLEGGE